MLPHIHITISGYALMVGIGVFCALSLTYRRNHFFGFSLKEILALAGANAIGVVLGSKLLFFLVQLPELVREFSFRLLIERIMTSGFVFYGGLLGALLMTFFCCKLLKMRTKQVYNFLVPAYLIFHACGRLGCLMAGCCYGKESAFGFVMQDGVRRFPVQLLECVCILFIVCYILWIERRKPETSLLTIYLSLYAPCRFGLEFLRADEIRGIWGIFSTSQWISVMILLVLICGRIQKKIKISNRDEQNSLIKK